MTRIYPTASSLDLAFQCQGFIKLGKPHGDTSDGMLRGSAGHKFLEDLAAAGDSYDETLKAVPSDHREMCARIEWTALPIVQGRENTELSFVLCPDGTVERIGRGRDYGQHRARGICGTADYVTAGSLGDYKFTDDDEYAGHPATHNQLRFLGSCFLALTGLPEVRLEIVQISPTTGKVQVRTHVYDQMESDIFVRRLWKHFGEPPLDLFTPGDHCFAPFKCPSVASCPAHVGSMMALVERGGLTFTEDQLPQILAWLEPAKAVIEGLDKAVKEYHKQHTTEMPDGRRFGPTSRNIRTIISPEKAVEVLRLLGVDAAPAVKHETSMTIGAVENLHRDAMALLEREGCVATKKIAGAGWLKKEKA